MQEPYKTFWELQKLVSPTITDTSFLFFLPTGDADICDYGLGYLAVQFDVTKVDKDGEVNLHILSVDDSSATFTGKADKVTFDAALNLVYTWVTGLPDWDTMYTQAMNIGFFGYYE